MHYTHAHGCRGRHGRAQWWREAHRAFDKHFSNRSYHIDEQDDRFEILVFAPGVEKENIKLTVKNDKLKVSCRSPEPEEEEFNWLQPPQRRGFTRSFDLNNKIIVEEITASYADGVLKIVLPKNPETNRPPQEITIN